MFCGDRITRFGDRSNSTHLSGAHVGRRVQVVGYDTGAGDDESAALLIADAGAVDREPLVPGRELCYTLGERRCAGTVVDHVHRACENPEAPYCLEHTHRWPCARCTGDCELPLENCREEHALYLAAFAPDRFKVGVTKTWRLRTRLCEQGADRAAHIRTVVDGRIARQIEAEIAGEIPDRIRIPEKVAGLHLTVDEDAWHELLAGFDVIEAFDFEYGLDLDAQPVAETLATGTVLGTKGRLLVLARKTGTYVVDVRDLVGHEIEARASSRDLQSSLGSFG